MFSASPSLLGPARKPSRSKSALEPVEQNGDPGPAPGTHSLAVVSTPRRIARMLGLQTPQTGEDGKEEEISCCGSLVVNEFLMLYMALAYGTCVCRRGLGWWGVVWWGVVWVVVLCRVQLPLHAISPSPNRRVSTCRVIKHECPHKPHS